MTKANPASTSVFHLSLNVGNLERSVRFFELLFGTPPMKRKTDYAKFEPADLPLILSLQQADAPCTAGPLNHAGLRVSTSAALIDIQRRLELAGIPTLRENGVECCYARQTKFWVRDPDENQWEVYVLEADLPHRGEGTVPRTIGLIADPTPCCEGGSITPATVE